MSFLQFPPLPLLLVLILIGISITLVFVKFNDKFNYETGFWVLTHFQLWFFIGLFHPHNYIFFVIANTIWEIFEEILSIQNKWYLEKEKKIYDVVFGFVGYYLGSKIAVSCST